MNLIILASHGKLAQGMKHTAEMIIGDTKQIYAFGAYREEEQSIKKKIEKVISRTNEQTDVYLLTDILGGSVNTEVMQLLRDYPDIQIVTGMNLPLVLSLATQSEKISDKRLEELLEESRQAVLDCTRLVKEKTKEEEL
ncbi:MULTISPECIES: PTS fructose transporter subunit IIA [unclassified Enterococcus]|uniref:PTS sugar transporter subunit IIA n=1 Tax=unclassified Enterococcus TaxID=2608891 RepID=UPI0013EDF9D4|nr:MULTISPECIES: PTS fructose transporter subunit IIA [unclassified Enterococcus]